MSDPKPTIQFTFGKPAIVPESESSLRQPVDRVLNYAQHASPPPRVSRLGVLSFALAVLGCPCLAKFWLAWLFFSRVKEASFLSGVLIYLVMPLASIVIGWIAQSRIRRNPTRLCGDEFAMLGIALGGLFVAGILAFAILLSQFHQ